MAYSKNIIRSLLWCSITCLFSLSASAQTGHSSAPDSIRLNQIGFYPAASKTAIVLTGNVQPFTIQTPGKKVVFSGKLKPSPRPDLSGRTIYVADFTALQQPGQYRLVVPGVGQSYLFQIGNQVHAGVAAGAIKAFYYQRVSTALPEKYAGKWARAAGHPDTAVLVHPSAATAQRPAGTVISASRGWYDAGDYNKYIVNSGISMGTLLSLYEDFPTYVKTVKLNIPESNNQVPDLLDEALWNLRWMLTMQDPNDGGVYHKLTNAAFDGMVMPDKAVQPRYVVQKGTAATLDFAAVMSQASRIYENYNQQLPGLADSCLKAAEKAWQWAQAHPNAVYDQDAMNSRFEPKVSTGAYGDNHFDDERTWAAAELYITTKNDTYLKAVPWSNTIRFTIPSWAQVQTLGYYSLLRNRNQLTAAGKKAVPQLSHQLLALADSLANPATLPAYQTVMGRSAHDFGWGSNSDAANQGITLIQAYQLTRQAKYLNAALSNLDYILGRNGTGYCMVTGFGSKSTRHPHHRPSVADGIADPVPGLMAGGPNPGMQDHIQVPSTIPNQAYIDDDRAYAVNEIAINWNAPFAYLANAIEALQYQAGYVKK
ncbi:cellulase [Mucilaginibacter robiniae]|uniref:Endoglucanase n=1 Tax=Mucilaginibacter robiniae TaxID=2728022 RepID=A0A7L5DZG6_9SPHI|nr:glycoside hydrolase family 9 protein [Mucilaginibacter robiniae]QJD96375.1 cellulase [Mucilaginibacter robiniae]